MSIRIVVKSEAVSTRSGMGKNGKPFAFREQSAAIDAGGDFPLPFRIRLASDQPVYKPGVYSLAADSYRVGQYGDLEIRFPHFEPVVVEPVKKA